VIENIEFYEWCNLIKEGGTLMPKLSRKAQRLHDYLIAGGSTNIGDICRNLHTTPITLLSKTIPELQEKGLFFNLGCSQTETRKDD